MNKVKIYNQRVAGFLLLSGLPLAYVGENENKPEYFTFYFKNSEELQGALDYYSAHRDEIQSVRYYY